MVLAETSTPEDNVGALTPATSTYFSVWSIVLPATGTQQISFQMACHERRKKEDCKLDPSLSVSHWVTLPLRVAFLSSSDGCLAASTSVLLRMASEKLRRVELLAIVRETIRGCSISISELIFLQLKQIGSTLLQTCFLPVAPQSSEPRFLTKEETLSPHPRGRQQRGWLWSLSQSQLMLTLFVVWQLPIPGCSKDCWIL